MKPRTAFNIDPVALRAKYRTERDKRLRADGNDQYVEIKGQFAHYRRPLCGARIHAQGTDRRGRGRGDRRRVQRTRGSGTATSGWVADIRIIEKGGDFGGTWYWNRYPGASCDIDSYIYLPLLEEVGYMPVEKYSKAAEILAHSRAIGEKFDLYKNACLQTEVTELRWNEEDDRWIVSTNRGDAMKARFVVMANGLLHRPKLPAIPGIESFKGHAFHTSRWDYSYTRGDCTAGSLVCRTSASRSSAWSTAVQCVPHVGAWARELYVFQRTPPSIGVRANKPTDPEWASRLQPGWQKERMDNFNILVAGGFQEVDLVHDGWTDILRELKRPESNDAGDMSKNLQLADFQSMEAIRARVDAIVKDRATAEALKPWYNRFCKRPCFSDEYLDTFNRPNVHLIDTDGKGVEAISEHSIIANGQEFEIDCLIYATGFEVGTSYTRRSGYEVYGRAGVPLTQKWSDGISSLHGMHTRGFPNCFIMMHSQATITPTTLTSSTSNPIIWRISSNRSSTVRRGSSRSRRRRKISGCRLSWRQHPTLVSTRNAPRATTITKASPWPSLSATAHMAAAPSPSFS